MKTTADRRNRYTVTPADYNENNNNNNGSFDEEDDLSATHRVQFTHADTSQFKSKLNFQTSKSPFTKEGTFSNLDTNWKQPEDRNTSEKPSLLRVNEESFIVGSATLGRRVGKDANNHLPEGHSVRSFWNIPPNNGQVNNTAKMEEYSTPTSVKSARSSRQRPWKRPTNAGGDMPVAPPPMNYQQLLKHHYDFSTLPRSHKKQPVIGRNPVLGLEPGLCQSEMSDSGIEIRANHLGLHQNRDEYGNGYQQQNYNIHQAANNMNYENIPSYHWPNSQAVTSPPSDIYSASRERDAGLCAEGRGASKAFRLASESRESYI